MPRLVEIKNHICPICSSVLKPRACRVLGAEEIAYFDCTYLIKRHFYSERRKNNSLFSIQVRYSDENKNLYFLNVYYKKMLIEVWKSHEYADAQEKIIIKLDQMPELNFADKDKMIQKIKTYLTFS